MSLPWDERVPMLSINPDAATRDDIARMAAELMQKRNELQKAKTMLRKIAYPKRGTQEDSMDIQDAAIMISVEFSLSELQED